MSFRDIEEKDVSDVGVIFAKLTCHGCEDTELEAQVQSIDDHVMARYPFSILYSKARLEGWKYDEKNEMLVCKGCVNHVQP